ncbi:ABC transporter permease [uncultured Thiodictyon sp.]|uniref:ABC transporter permease n=1 Tax=uncultured Thiodictyon sp. TaxID=1846217 RepID=UPI0025FFF875|nr:ABC transporter permease [uncultured Thiodictyon sp.]
MWRRILAILVARNREFYRDRAGLGWNILMPILIVLGFAFIFSGDPPDQFKVGVLAADTAAPPPSAFLALKHIQFVPVTDLAGAVTKVDRHQLDLLLDPRSSPPSYWVNLESPSGYLAERLLLGAGDGAATNAAAPQRHTLTGAAVSYADWVLPGILAMNVMFSSLWGVGYVIVRYRKNGVLRRLKATPLSAFEFLTAQVLSRLLVVMGASLVVFVGADLLLHFTMRGSYLALVLVYATGALCLISLGLIVAARLRTEELADGILNLLSWPMLLFSGVWFSMEGTSAAARVLSQLSPLTHLVDAARRIMIDGAGVLEVLPQVVLLAALAAVFLSVAAWLFRWE